MAIIPHSVRAASAAGAGTHVSGALADSAVWDAEHSPYLLDGDTIVPSGKKLTISAGASVALASGAASSSLIVSPYASLSIEGTAQAPALVSGIDRILAGDPASDEANVRITQARLSGGTSLVLHQSRARISSTTISGAIGPALYAWGAAVDAEGLRLEESGSDPLVLITPDMITGAQPDARIHDSSFVGQGIYVADNSGAVAHMERNWWGSDADPTTVAGNFLQGKVSYDPWLGHDPTAGMLDPVAAPACCSSVLFIPGLEGTRLYSESGRVWEPVSDAAARRLFLDESGTSIDSSVRPGEPIGKAYGAKGIYGSFMAFLDGLKAGGKISDWRAFGYDWRLPVERIASSTALADAVAALASTSKTGKVSIVAHSNGGLVAKSFVRGLESTGAHDAVDAVISVGVPYLGTPAAIGALLHGDGQSILGGLFMSRGTARRLGANMPSAYGLLPSAAFFERLIAPAVVYASTTGAVSDRAAFGAFIESMGGNRTLMAAAEALHALLDPYPWPVSVASWALVGLGRPTPQSVRYEERKGCDAPGSILWCWGSKLLHAASLVSNGDGTVLAGSASHGSERVVPIDLDRASAGAGKSFAHADILESTTTQAVIEGIIEGATPFDRSASSSIAEVPMIPELPMLIVKSTPLLEIEARDAAGRRTGLRSDGSYEEAIPGSRFEADPGAEGGGFSIALPDAGGAYAISGKGVGFGFFSVSVERALAGATIDSAEYELSPVSPLATASTTIGGGGSLASSSPIEIDADGDGRPEREAHTGGNGMPGNATSSEEAGRIAREESLEIIRQTDTDALRDDPGRAALIERLFPTGGSSGSGAPTAPAVPAPETKPPAQGAGGCER